MSVGTARALFLVYAALTGLTFSMYFLIFDLTILIYAFAATGILFGGMAAASLIFKMELDSIRPLLFGGLIMLIIVGVLGMFLNLGAFNVMICYLGIAIFLGYTAYDTAKIRQNYEYYSQMGDSVILEKASIFSALQLYLDFVNLFLYILRLLGSSRGSRK
jgi:FtsH-binding integral membrane protein